MYFSYHYASILCKLSLPTRTWVMFAPHDNTPAQVFWHQGFHNGSRFYTLYTFKHEMLFNELPNTNFRNHCNKLWRQNLPSIQLTDSDNQLCAKTGAQFVSLKRTCRRHTLLSQSWPRLREYVGVNVAELRLATFDVVGGKAVIIAARWECGKGRGGTLTAFKNVVPL